MTLPLIPGYSINHNIGKTRFNRPSRFIFENNIPQESDEQSKREKLSKLSSRATLAIHPPKLEPAWKAFDKYVLCFDAIYHETIVGVSQIEKYRYRRCKIYYFLEDDTMEIIEKLQRNSGLPQGTIIKRHRFKKSRENNDDEFYTLDDLNIGISLEIYGRLYKITDCDNFTRRFLTEIGTRVNDPVPEPSDPYTEHRKLLEDTTASRKPLERKDKLGQFLIYHPNMLKFHCLWDDTYNMFGAKRLMTLYYYLDDDTIQIIETRESNSGRDDTTTFLKRSLLPKNVEHVSKPGEMVDRTVLNTACIRDNFKQYLLDNNPLKERTVEFIKHGDLDLGRIINVHGRNFLLYDCDQYTKKFYEDKYGKVLVPVDIPKDMRPVLQREIPKSFLIGKAEDTIQNCQSLKPKPAKKDAAKFYKFDKYGYESNQMTFAALILTDNTIKRSRRFIITLYLADCTIQINEPHQQNSGIMDGKQLIRVKVERPDSKKSLVPIYYSERDFYVGATLCIKGDYYILTNADEYTYKYMETHPEKFPHSRITTVVQKVREMVSDKSSVMKLYFESVDGERSGFVDFVTFRSAVTDALPTKLYEQEIITLGRYYAAMDDVDSKWSEILSMVQTELRRKNYNEFDNLCLALQEFDKGKTGVFTKDQLFIHLKSCNLPLAPDLLKTFLDKFPGSVNDGIVYSSMLNALDYFNNPVAVYCPTASVFDINWKKIVEMKSLGRINYIKFIEDMEP